MILKAENISKKFGKNGLNPASISIETEQFLCITGESGCGKTTLFNIISGMLRPDTGTVTLDSRDIFKMKERERTMLRNDTIGYMTQGNSLIPELTVWDNIIGPSELYGKKTNEADVMALAEKLRIDNVVDSFPSELSGGEYRRVLLARVMILNTPILLVDEPTSNLDEKSAAIVREVIYEEYQNGKGIAVVTHDKEFEKYTTDKVHMTARGESDEE